VSVARLKVVHSEIAGSSVFVDFHLFFANALGKSETPGAIWRIWSSTKFSTVKCVDFALFVCRRNST
jgi:hypothetical protein